MMDCEFLSRCLLVVLITRSVLADTGYFWHITDFHYDFTYHDLQLSCNPAQLPTDPGKFGDFWCDSPWSLVNSSVHAMARIQPDADFILWTGDTILHGTDEEVNYTINAVVLDNTTDILRDVLPDVPVYATYGNHDYWPNNQFPPHNNLLYNDTWIRWEDWVNDTTQENNFRKGGYYTVKTQYGLRIVALNTNLYYTSNKATLDESDPADQFQWMNKTLHAARMSDDKVLVTAHIPPGVHTPGVLIWMHEKYHNPLVSILRQYVDIIVGMHFGHDHSDGFKILHDSTGQYEAPIFIAPSVTPWRYIIPNAIGPAHNPGIRLVEYDRTTGMHIDIKQYYLDLTRANEEGAADWELEYTFSEVYGTQSLTGSAIESVVRTMQGSNGGQMLTKFWQHFTVSPPKNLLEPCNDQCREAILCGLDNFDMNSFEACKRGMISGTSSMFTSIRMFVIAVGYYMHLIFY